jgi:hypothetical protein
MFELAVAAFCRDKKPAIFTQLLQYIYIANLHPAGISQSR